MRGTGAAAGGQLMAGKAGRGPLSLRQSRFSAIALAAILILSLMAVTYHRNQAWQTLLSLWEDCAAKSPQKSRTHNNLGNCYMLLGRHFQAIAEYEQAIALDPNNIEAYYNLAINLDTVGLTGPSVRYYAVFCDRAPRSYENARLQACKRLRELTATPAGRVDR